MSRAAVARPTRPSMRAAARTALLNYLKQSEKPLTSLVFVLPMIALYEIGWRFSASRLLAFNLLHQFFALFGATGTLLPAGALIGILLCCHLLNRDKWTVNLGTLAGMLLESFLLALPLLALACGLARVQWRPILAGTSGEVYDRLVIAMGAGVYEELIFRLIALTLLHFLFVDILRMPKSRAALLMVLLSAVLFSFYHYLGVERFAWKTCLFRTVAGIYFGGIFMCRGFGVTAGCHTIYDMILLGLSPWG